MGLRVATQLNNEIEQLGKEVVDCLFHVHKEMRPGLLENIYEECLCFELRDRNIQFERQKPIPLFYKKHKLNLDYRIDLLIENQIVIELKSVEKLIELHKAQLLSYMHLTDTRLGYLVNFNVPLIKDGIQRMVL